MNIRKNDTVLVITGKDKGKKGKVRSAYPKNEQIVIDGVNFIKRHTRAKKTARQAGIIELEAPMHVSNVMLLCNKCNHPTRIDLRRLENDRKVRICHSCREVID